MHSQSMILYFIKSNLLLAIIYGFNFLEIPNKFDFMSYYY